MRHRAIWLLAMFGLCVGSPALSGDRIGIGVKAGTLGLGVDVTGRVNNWVSLRASVNGADASRSYSESDVDYDGDFKFGAYGLLVDFHPLKGNFRLTAGLMKNRNSIDLTARPTADVEIGNNTYTPAQVGTLTGDVRFKDTVPYLGIGFGSAARAPGRVRFVLDAGVLEQGSGSVSISSSLTQVAGTRSRTTGSGP